MNLRVRMLQGRAKRGQGRWSLIKKTSLASMNSCRFGVERLGFTWRISFLSVG